MNANILKANAFALDFFYKNLKSYLTNSHLSEFILTNKLKLEIIEEFQIGYASPNWESLSQQLSKSNISLTVAEEAALLKRCHDGNGYYDVFRSRLMFPIHSSTGNVVAFGARAIESADAPKWLTSRGPPVLNKYFYGLVKTAKHVQEQNSVIIVEGFLDLIILYQFEIKNVVATMGGRLSPERINLIKAHTDKVILIFDNDPAGLAGSIDAKIELSSAGLKTANLTLPYQGPSNFILNFGAEALKQLIKKSLKEISC